jgi:microcystin-dependent protein
MSTPYISEIKMVSFGFAPQGWALCNGQLLPINQNQALFSLLGTTYGGDGRVNFALPNLQVRAPMHMSNVHILGQAGGEISHTLSINELPAHIHFANAVNATADAGNPGRVPGPTKALAQAHAATSNGAVAVNIYGTGGANEQFSPGAISNIGGSQPHTNQQPYLTLNFVIALQGIFPSQN